MAEEISEAKKKRANPLLQLQYQEPSKKRKKQPPPQRKLGRARATTATSSETVAADNVSSTEKMEKQVEKESEDIEPNYPPKEQDAPPEHKTEKQMEKEKRLFRPKSGFPSPPPTWKQMWDGIVEMRKDKTAPVDSMGASTLADLTTDPAVKRFQTLISIMLSSQTRDQQTALAMERLKAFGLTIDHILETPEAELSKLINCVGFHQAKARYMKKTSEILKNEYNSDIPTEYKDLIKLPGVGPKVAHLTLQCAWDRTEGICVDVHVHRISNRLGWVNTKDPEATRKALEEWLPRENWRPINSLLVGFGQTRCLPTRPRCEGCLINNLCPTGMRLLAEKDRDIANKTSDEASATVEYTELEGDGQNTEGQ